MKQPVPPHAIHTTLGNNNILVVIPNGFSGSRSKDTTGSLTEFGRFFTAKLGCYAVINNKYKRSIIDLADVEAAKSRKKTTDNYLLQIKRFKDEISGNGLLPLVLIVQTAPYQGGDQNHIIFGYGQGERGRKDRPHSPTIAPSVLAKFRVALEDHSISTSVASTATVYCGNAPNSINQLFRQKNYLEGFFDPEVRSLLLTLSLDLVKDDNAARTTASTLAKAFAPFQQKMSLVRRIAIDNIDTLSDEDLQYIFRIHNDSRYNELARESYINELASSIKRNGLLHPLVLLQKPDGRYRILCGFRRFQAIKSIQQKWVEAKVFEEEDFSTEDFFNISLAENTKRRNLNPVEIGNFLDTASQTMNLNNTMLAERFGATLGIGTPGQKVSHSTIHKYRKVNQIRSRGESPEIINDLINEKLQFSIASEILAPIKNPEDRDTLYLEIIKPLSPTRPQLKKIVELLDRDGNSLHEAINSPSVKKSIAKSMESKQKSGTFIRLLQQKPGSPQRFGHELTKKVSRVRKSYFGEKAGTKDFNISSDKAGKGAFSINVRVTKDNYQEILNKVVTLLEKENLLESDQ